MWSFNDLKTCFLQNNIGPRQWSESSIDDLMKWLQNHNIPLPFQPYIRNRTLFSINNDPRSTLDFEQTESHAVIVQESKDIALLARDSICTVPLDSFSSDSDATLSCTLQWSALFPSSASMDGQLKSLKSACPLSSIEDAYLLLPILGKFPLYITRSQKSDLFLTDPFDILKPKEIIIAICDGGKQKFHGSIKRTPSFYMVTRRPRYGFKALHFTDRLYHIGYQLKSDESKVDMIHLEHIPIQKSYQTIQSIVYVKKRRTLYLADIGQHCIWTYHQKVWSQIGPGKKKSAGFIDGSFRYVRLHMPDFLTVDVNGYVYVIDRQNRAIRVIHHQTNSVCTVRHPMSRMPMVFNQAPLGICVSPIHTNTLHVLLPNNQVHILHWWHQSTELMVILQHIMESIYQSILPEDVSLIIVGYIYWKDEMNFCNTQSLPLDAWTQRLILEYYHFAQACYRYHSQYLQERLPELFANGKAPNETFDVKRFECTKLYESD